MPHILCSLCDVKYPISDFEDEADLVIECPTCGVPLGMEEQEAYHYLALQEEQAYLSGGVEVQHAPDALAPEYEPPGQRVGRRLAFEFALYLTREGLSRQDILAALVECVATSLAPIAGDEDATAEEPRDVLAAFSEAMSARTLELVQQQRDQEPPLP